MSRSMDKNTRFVGLDVHAETIAVSLWQFAEGRNQVRSLPTIANRPEAVRRLLLCKVTELKVCYEAGPRDTRCIGSCSWAGSEDGVNF